MPKTPTLGSTDNAGNSVNFVSESWDFSVCRSETDDKFYSSVQSFYFQHHNEGSPELSLVYNMRFAVFGGWCRLFAWPCWKGVLSFYFLTLKAPNKNCSRRHFKFYFYFSENSLETPSLIFSEKQRKIFWMSSAAVVFGAFRVLTVIATLNIYHKTVSHSVYIPPKRNVVWCYHIPNISRVPYDEGQLKPLKPFIWKSLKKRNFGIEWGRRKHRPRLLIRRPGESRQPGE